MMIYAIYDKKAESFKEIIQAENDDMCKRILYRILSGAQQSDYVMFPYDFAVYRVANFNQRTGSVFGKDVKAIAFEMISLFSKPTDQDESPTVDSSVPEASINEVKGEVNEIS